MTETDRRLPIDRATAVPGTPKNGPSLVEGLPVKKIHGVGPATAEKMRRLGIESGADLRSKT
ncbi:DNA polymerase-4 [Rhizobium mongolense]|uniref:DNA polymerase-4 n=1 Tax=Rhizobium mongolense TaxID=57676 RepID=A0ABR6IEK3_9HYPH|nr:DNA polymerase-4 [Rhizobium mongolense]